MMPSLIEIIAAVSGIVSVWFSRKASIWVYPTGLINTIFYIWISYDAQLIGEATVNLYYTMMSLYGWFNWLRRNEKKELIVQITHSSRKDWLTQCSFFIVIYLLLFVSIRYLQDAFFPGAIPWADALASAAAFTGMWLMTQKKVESWIWWLITNIVSMPLYFIKGYVFTSVYYLVLLVLAVLGWLEWKKKSQLNVS
jgi:nicotinamide mononucleotide transporter